MEQETRTPVTGGADRWPVFDRHGARIHVGDRLRAQVCTGRYGQTAIIETIITKAHWPYCQWNPPEAPRTVVRAEYEPSQPRALRCYYRHTDYEHAHEAWAEILPPAEGSEGSERS